MGDGTSSSGRARPVFKQMSTLARWSNAENNGRLHQLIVHGNFLVFFLTQEKWCCDRCVRHFCSAHSSQFAGICSWRRRPWAIPPGISLRRDPFSHGVLISQSQFQLQYPNMMIQGSPRNPTASCQVICCWDCIPLSYHLWLIELARLWANPKIFLVFNSVKLLPESFQGSTNLLFPRNVFDRFCFACGRTDKMLVRYSHERKEKINTLRWKPAAWLPLSRPPNIWQKAGGRLVKPGENMSENASDNLMKIWWHPDWKPGDNQVII